jgi:hypothetical protein
MNLAYGAEFCASSNGSQPKSKTRDQRVQRVQDGQLKYFLARFEHLIYEILRNTRFIGNVSHCSPVRSSSAPHRLGGLNDLRSSSAAGEALANKRAFSLSVNRIHRSNQAVFSAAGVKGAEACSHI